MKLLYKNEEDPVLISTYNGQKYFLYETAYGPLSIIDNSCTALGIFYTVTIDNYVVTVTKNDEEAVQESNLPAEIMVDLLQDASRSERDYRRLKYYLFPDTEKWGN